MREVETIVVGGGPAGASAAWELVRRGRECLVLDRAQFPREKLCAGWITPEVLADLEFTPSDYPHRFLTFGALNVNVGRWRQQLRSPQHSIRRFEFDAWLLERSGAPAIQNNVRNIESDGDRFILDDAFRCRYLIGAGGTRCPVYRELFRDAHRRDERLQAVTLELEYAYDYNDANCHLWFFADGLPGYSWYVPKADGYVNIGIGASATRLKRRGEHIRDHWQALVQTLVSRGLIHEPPAEPHGYSYFLRHQRATPTRIGNAYVVGDAAGLATRDMCEGIGPAVRSGLDAAASIINNASYSHDDIDRYTNPRWWVHRPLEAGIIGLGKDAA